MGSVLSKSGFISGWRCPLKLWNDCYRPGLAAPVDEARQAIRAAGEAVGRLARQRWPGGVLVDEPDMDRALVRTGALLADPAVEVIYEAAVKGGGAAIRVDILLRTPQGGWELVEVKSATRAKSPYDIDLALQYRVLVQAGLKVDRVGLLVLNRDYRYAGGALDLAALFRLEDLTGYCQANSGWVNEQLTRLQAVLERPEPPEVAVGEQCRRPYACGYHAHCIRNLDLPAHPLRMLPNLAGRRYRALVEQGIVSIEEIPGDYPLTVPQARVRDSIASGRPWISPQLRAALESAEWPLFFLDFEAAPQAIPRFAGMRPFDPLPFQFSCHIQRRPDAALEHAEFLATDSDDPRPALAKALLETLEERGTVVVYSGYEARTIQLLAAQLPDLRAALLALLDRLQDLLVILRAHYYHPGFGGSFSIKKVLPALVDNADYSGMPVADGQAAAAAWQRMLVTGDRAERARIEQALRDYCRKDSWAMAALREALLTQAGGAGPDPSGESARNLQCRS